MWARVHGRAQGERKSRAWRGPASQAQKQVQVQMQVQMWVQMQMQMQMRV